MTFNDDDLLPTRPCPHTLNFSRTNLSATSISPKLFIFSVCPPFSRLSLRPPGWRQIFWKMRMINRPQRTSRESFHAVYALVFDGTIYGHAAVSRTRDFQPLAVTSIVHTFVPRHRWVLALFQDERQVQIDR